MDNNSLTHHGVVGMKWGVRRYQNKDGTLTAKGKARQEQKNSETQKREDVKRRGTLTTSELKQKIERLQMEKQLRELTESEITPGKKAVNNVLLQIGTKVATTALTGAALYAIKAAVSKNFSAAELGSAIFNGGSKKK